MRLDRFLVENNYFPSRNKAHESITLGEVYVNEKKIIKPSFEVDENAEIKIEKVRSFFVSNGGFKLEKAINCFALDINNKVCLDIGASNGGFTHCLLLNGAKKVVALDVGENQLEKSLVDDSRVIIKDKTNARDITAKDFDEKFDAIVSDVSFISLKYIMPVINGIAKENADVVLLIKPQFECGKKALNKNGIVKDKKEHIRVIQELYDFALNCNLTPFGLTFSPIRENKNIEYLFYLKNGIVSPRLKKDELKNIIDSVK